MKRTTVSPDTASVNPRSGVPEDGDEVGRRGLSESKRTSKKEDVFIPADLHLPFCLTSRDGRRVARRYKARAPASLLLLSRAMAYSGAVFKGNVAPVDCVSGQKPLAPTVYSFVQPLSSVAGPPLGECCEVYNFE